MSLIGAKMHDSFAESVQDCLICAMSHADVERMRRRELEGQLLPQGEVPHRQRAVEDDA